MPLDPSRLFDVPEVPTLETISISATRTTTGVINMAVYSHHVFGGERQCAREEYMRLTLSEVYDVALAELSRLELPPGEA